MTAICLDSNAWYMQIRNSMVPWNVLNISTSLQFGNTSTLCVIVWQQVHHCIRRPCEICPGHRYEFLVYALKMWSIDAIWRHRTWSTLAQLMAWWLVAPMLTKHQSGTLIFIWGWNLIHLSLRLVWKILIQNCIQISPEDNKLILFNVCLYIYTGFQMHLIYIPCSCSNSRTSSKSPVNIRCRLITRRPKTCESSLL